MGITTKIGLGFLFCILLTAFMGVFVFLSMQQINKNLILVKIADDIEFQLLECRRQEKNFLLFHEVENLNKLNIHLDKLKKFISKSQSNASKDNLQQFHKLSQSIFVYEKLLNQVLSGKADIEKSISLMRKAGQDAQKISRGISNKTWENIKSTAKKSAIIAITTIGFVVLISIVWGVIVFQTIAAPIRDIAFVTTKIAEGDISKRVTVKSRDEIGVLAKSLNEMTRKLQQAYRKLEGKIEIVTRELADKQRQLAQSEKLASIGQLSSGVAHEINTPLGGILANAYFLLEEMDEKNPQKKELDIIIRETMRCKNIVKGLLDFSRQETPQKEPVDINQIVDRTLSAMRHHEIADGLTVNKKLNPDLPKIIADPNQLQQVFMNITKNALQAMTEKGKLDIATYVKGDFIIIDFIDTGRGISTEYINKVFEPFFTMGKSQKGIGLGLAISYGIIKNHHGNIDVESKVGKRTKFSVKLPIEAKVKK